MIREFWDKNWREAVRWQQNTGVPGRVWQWDNDGDVSQVFSSNSEWFSISDQGWLVEERRQRWRVRRECTHCTVQCTWSVQASVSCVVFSVSCYNAGDGHRAGAWLLSTVQTLIFTSETFIIIIIIIIISAKIIFSDIISDMFSASVMFLTPVFSSLS